MSVDARAEAHHIETYTGNVQMVAQQLNPRIRPHVTDVTGVGKAMDAADLVGKVHAVETGGRDRRNIDNAIDGSRRWLILPNPIKSGQYVDQQEVLERAMDPTSKYVKGHTSAVMRGVDDRIMGVRRAAEGRYELREGGILGGAIDGRTPGSGSRVMLPTDCYTPAASSGLTLRKLKDAKQRLNTDEFGMDDGDEMFSAITPAQVTDLLDLADGDGTSLNAFQQRQLENGVPTPLIGFTWVVTNALPFDDAGNRMCPIWSKANIVAGFWEEINGKMWNDTSADNTPYLKAQARVDAVRVEDKGVQVLLCQE